MESPPTTNEESIWVSRCKAGDRKAFEPLVRMNATRIRNVVWGLLGSQRENVVDDVVQEVFLKAYLALPKFRGDSKFSTWLYRIAVNHCRDTIRRSPPPMVEMDEALLAVQTAPSHPEGAEAEDEDSARARREADLTRLLGALKEKQRRIIVLREIEGMSYEEIGKILRIPPGTVRSRLNRARARLLRAAADLKEQGR